MTECRWRWPMRYGSTVRRIFCSLCLMELQEPFTVKEFAQTAGIHRDLAGSTLPLLTYMQLLARAGKRGREYLYEVDDNYR